GSFAVELERIVVRGPLPRAFARGRALLEDRGIDILARKIMVAFDHHGAVTMRDDLVVPDSLDRHARLLRRCSPRVESRVAGIGSNHPGGAGMIRTGIGGWTYPDWRKGVFYPEGLAQKRELEWASRQLGAIEINGTAHSLQKPESFRKWREATPEGFVFAVKGSAYVTNRKVLASAGDS